MPFKPIVRPAFLADVPEAGPAVEVEVDAGEVEEADEAVAGRVDRPMDSCSMSTYSLSVVDFDDEIGVELEPVSSSAADEIADDTVDAADATDDPAESTFDDPDPDA